MKGARWPAGQHRRGGQRSAGRPAAKRVRRRGLMRLPMAIHAMSLPHTRLLCEQANVLRERRMVQLCAFISHAAQYKSPADRQASASRSTSLAVATGHSGPPLAFPSPQEHVDQVHCPTPPTDVMVAWRRQQYRPASRPATWCLSSTRLTLRAMLASLRTLTGCH